MAATELLVVAGPNGSGKTSFAEEFLSGSPYTYISADAIASAMSTADPASMRFAAGREFHRRVANHLSGKDDLLVESTLSGVTFRRVVDKARLRGFTICIVFIYVDSAETCIARVQERTRKGGHAVPDADVRRRFRRSLTNFWHVYRPIADYWILVYNGGDASQFIATGWGENLSIHDQLRFDDFRRLVQPKRDE